MQRTIEVNDTLQDCVDSAIEDVKTCLDEYLEEHHERGEEDISLDMSDLDYSGAIHEIVDSSVPIYTHEIETAYYLHGDRIDEAFDDAGLGSRDDDDWPMGWKAAAIYCYIEQEVNQWFYDNAEEVIEKFAAVEEDA